MVQKLQHKKMTYANVPLIFSKFKDCGKQKEEKN